MACDLEAFFHVSAIMLQFFSNMLIAWRSYHSVIQQKTLSPTTAFLMSLAAWLFSCIGTFITGRFSTIYLLPAGSYCFCRLALSLAFAEY